VASDEQEQLFDFGVPPEEEHRPPKRHESAEELVARVEAVHAAASRVRSRRRVVDEAAEAYLTAFPLEELDAPRGNPHPEGPGMEHRGADRLEGDGTPDEMDDPEASLTIAAFYERVRRALAREFEDEVWVSGEIRGFRESRGHRYLELADAGSENATGRNAAQQLEVVCWAREWPAIGRSLEEAGVELEVGRVVRVRGKVSVWEGGSKLRFTLTALDVEALLGGIAAARRRLLAALSAEGLLERNAGLELAQVPLRIGVITSPGSEGHRDFVGQLERSGFAFVIHVEPSLVQGADAPRQLVAALDRLRAFAPELAVIVRGGGARGDLAAFDAEEVARAIADAPFPVWAGIGHTGDRSVADEVVHRSWITPTACGEAIVARVTAYWEDVERMTRALARVVRGRLENAADRLADIERGIARSARHQLDRRESELVVARSAAVRATALALGGEGERTARRASAISGATRRALGTERAQMERRAQVLRAFDPRRQFDRGWSLVHRDGILVRSASDLAVGDTIVARFADGDATASVTGHRRSPERRA
jgi:exodeoxyribonuclease VII large subunit